MGTSDLGARGLGLPHSMPQPTAPCGAGTTWLEVWDPSSDPNSPDPGLSACFSPGLLLAHRAVVKTRKRDPLWGHHLEKVSPLPGRTEPLGEHTDV